jgi:RNA polymerase sigma-70 factor (ECF subfamily)
LPFGYIRPMISINDFTQAFEATRPQLRSYLLRLMTNVADTDDLVQDTYVKAHQSLGSFEGRSSLKTWLFTIATNLAKDLLRNKRRWPENVTDITREAALGNREFLGSMMQVRMSSPQGNFEIKEHITFCFACISKSLPLEQQVVIFLKEVYEFKVVEIAEIMGQTEAMVKYYLHAGRSKMIEVFDKRCALINKEGTCHQCSELNGIFNPKQKFQEEKVKLELVRAAENPDKEHLFDLRMKLVASIDPFHSGASELQLLHLQHNHEVMEHFLEKS